MVDINIFIIHYVLTTVLDRLDVIDNFFFLGISVYFELSFNYITYDQIANLCNKYLKNHVQMKPT